MRARENHLPFKATLIMFVTIRNNAYRDLCCGWIKDLVMGKGDTYHVKGDPKLRIKDNCPHVQY